MSFPKLHEPWISPVVLHGEIEKVFFKSFYCYEEEYKIGRKKRISSVNEIWIYKGSALKLTSIRLWLHRKRPLDLGFISIGNEISRWPSITSNPWKGACRIISALTR